MTEDDTCMNSYYARLGGVSNKEMIRIELEFLKLINFNVYISKDEFKKYKKDIMTYGVTPCAD